MIGTSLDQGQELDSLTKLPPDRQAQLIERAKAGKQVSAKTEVKKLKRAEQEIRLAERTRAASEQIGTKLYGVIYADPPWRFEPYSRETGMDRAADNHYPTIETSDIASMNVPAADDCVLFLWVTVPMLTQAFDVMRAWGFEYRSGITWKKDRIGTGYWVRSEAEHLLIGVRGQVPAPAPGTQPRGVIEAEVGRHSEKPEIFAEIIEKIFPNLPRLEMFARQSRPGWDVWGNQVEQPSLADT